MRATLANERVATGAHRVVWVHLNGPIPPGMTINHRNGIRDDNRPTNLEMATSSEQRRHSLEVLAARRHRPIGALNPKTRLTEADVREIRHLREDGMMVKDIAARFEMNPKAVSKICQRRTWPHI